jgi:glucokinase
MDSQRIGVDIGGTKVAAGLVDGAGNIIFKTRVPMEAAGAPAIAFACVQRAIDAVFAVHPEARDSVAGIGICSPGPLDPLTGVVINPPNLPCWRNFPLAQSTATAYGISTHVDNDANAAALAEAIWGAAKRYRNVFYATLGTGIGTGIVFDGKIYYGRTGSAAEGGHVSIDYNGPECGCGKRGCIEALCSGPAIARRAVSKLASGPCESAITSIAGASEHITAEHVGEAFRRNDAIARQVLEETANLLTVWLGNIIDLIEPDVIVVGGGVSELISSWFDYTSQRLPMWSINQRCREIPIIRARYGSDAGIAGAAALVQSARCAASAQH